MVVLRDGVGVPAQRDGGVGVAKPRLHGLDIHAVRQQHGRLRVAQLVELEFHEGVLLAPFGPPVLEVVHADYGADVGAADRGLAVGHDADLGIRARPDRKGWMRKLSYEWLAGLREIVIDPVRCPLTFEEFAMKEYERDRDGSWLDIIPDGDDHSIDAVRYAVMDDVLRG